MPRAGLGRDAVVSAGAALADEIGFPNLTMAALAERLGVRTPSLYKHVASQEALHRAIALLALHEAADVIGEAVRGATGRAALARAAGAFRGFVLAHPGRYAATLGVATTGPDDPLVTAGSRVLSALTDVLRAYPVAEADLGHALRLLRSTFHGFATLEAGDGFQFPVDVDGSYEWLIDALDRGLRSAGAAS